jgi:hypothetical protein
MATKIRFEVTLLLVYALCALLVGTAIALGRGLPADNQHMLMPERFCQFPCLLNITPGETRRTTALGVLATLADFPIDQSGSIWSFQLPDDEGNLINGTVISGEDGVVQYMRLYTRRWAGLGVRLGDLMEEGRIYPTQVFRSCSGTFPVRLLLTFSGEPRISFAAIIDDSVTPFDPVSLIDVATSNVYFTQTLATIFGSGCYLPSEWRGFAPAWLYGDQPLPFP